ncbi:MAG: HmuY family protein [Chitinophagales bacterium]
MRKLFYILFPILLLTSCFKEEDKRQVNNETSVSIALGEDYSSVFYYNLSTQSVVAENKWIDWNLSFYAQEDDYFIKLNDAANMKAYKATQEQFEEVSAIDDVTNFILDDAKGTRNGIALLYEPTITKGDTIFYTNTTYILRLGKDVLGEEIGFKKIKLLYTYLNQYALRHSNLDGSEDYISIIKKDLTLNFVHFSFKNKGEIINIEPDKTTWDIVFTRSTDITVTLDSSIILPDYTVTSVLLNPYFTKAYKEESVDYKDATLFNIKNSSFTNQKNIIGYNWKAFDLINLTYAIRQNEFYVIKDINDFYYKLKFLSFNDPNTNIKGTISFQYEIIK